MYNVGKLEKQFTTAVLLRSTVQGQWVYDRSWTTTVSGFSVGFCMNEEGYLSPVRKITLLTFQLIAPVATFTPMTTAAFSWNIGKVIFFFVYNSSWYQINLHLHLNPNSSWYKLVLLVMFSSHSGSCLKKNTREWWNKSCQLPRWIRVWNGVSAQ